ncbi:MAG: cbb3-type cytochrome c oxidase subunit 3 [Bacteroidota bacterium]
MISEYFKTVNNGSIIPLISLVVFFALFIATTIWAIRLKKGYINHMENLPLDSNSENKNNFEMKNEVN